MAKTVKLDLYKEHKAEYAASKKAAALVEVGPVTYLSIVGRGGPGGKTFQAKIQAMYSMAFTIKMTRKFAGLGDYKICHLEGLWFCDKKGADFFDQPPETWRWKLLIRTPDFIKESDLKKAKQTLSDKGKPPEFNEVKLETITEGLCVQMLHIGPYATEGKTIAAMRQFAVDGDLILHGLHHEIYLSDPRRVPPERLRTILRLPARRRRRAT